MPLYMVSFGYTPETWARLVQAPENRSETVSRMLEDVGCSLRGLWYAFGKADGFALIEAPDEITGAGLSVALAASGAFRSFDTTVLISTEQMVEALGKAQEVAYTAPGAAVPA